MKGIGIQVHVQKWEQGNRNREDEEYLNRFQNTYHYLQQFGSDQLMKQKNLIKKCQNYYQRYYGNSPDFDIEEAAATLLEEITDYYEEHPAATDADIRNIFFSPPDAASRIQMRTHRLRSVLRYAVMILLVLLLAFGVISVIQHFRTPDISKAPVYPIDTIDSFDK